MSAEKRSISAPADLFQKADARKEQLGYATFSDYIQALMRADTLAHSGHVREVAPPYKTSSTAVEEAEKKIVKAIQDEADRIRKKSEKKKAP